MATNELLCHLRDLEISLHKHSVRSDRAKVGLLMHDSFVEFGQSGRRFNRVEILKFMQSENSTGEVWSQDFVMAEIGNDVVLLTWLANSVSSRDTNRYIRARNNVKNRFSGRLLPSRLLLRNVHFKQAPIRSNQVESRTLRGGQT